jgi:predicted RNA-binding Zn ribbon-like protein
MSSPDPAGLAAAASGFPGMATGEDPRVAPGRLELVRQFINTADISPGEDQLSDLGALRTWLRQHGLIGAREDLGQGDLERALAVREGLRQLLEERASGALEATALRSLNALLAGAVARVAFDRDGTPALQPAAATPFERALAELLAIIERAAGDGSWARLKVCADHGCRWAFYDRSKNRSRSWCNMAVCGNRAKARDYRRRRRDGGASPAGPGTQ